MTQNRNSRDSYSRRNRFNEKAVWAGFGDSDASTLVYFIVAPEAAAPVAIVLRDLSIALQLTQSIVSRCFGLSNLSACLLSVPCSILNRIFIRGLFFLVFPKKAQHYRRQ